MTPRRYIPDPYERSQQEAAGVFSYARSYQTRLRMILRGRPYELYKAVYWNKREHQPAISGRQEWLWRWRWAVWTAN